MEEDSPARAILFGRNNINIRHLKIIRSFTEAITIIETVRMTGRAIRYFVLFSPPVRVIILKNLVCSKANNSFRRFLHRE